MTVNRTKKRPNLAKAFKTLLFHVFFVALVLAHLLRRESQTFSDRPFSGRLDETFCGCRVDPDETEKDFISCPRAVNERVLFFLFETLPLAIHRFSLQNCRELLCNYTNDFLFPETIIITFLHHSHSWHKSGDESVLSSALVKP